MLIHRYHPEEGEEEALLYPNCARCQEHARDILSLDQQKFIALWNEMIRVEFKNEKDYYQNSTIARACERMYWAATMMHRYFGVDVKNMTRETIQDVRNGSQS